MIQKVFDGTNRIGADCLLSIFSIKQAGGAAPTFEGVLYNDGFTFGSWTHSGVGNYTVSVGNVFSNGVVGKVTQNSNALTAPVFFKLINTSLSSIRLNCFDIAGAPVELSTSATISIKILKSGGIQIMPIISNQSNTQQAYFEFSAWLNLAAGAPTFQAIVYNSFFGILPVLANTAPGINTIQFPTVDFTINIPFVHITQRSNANPIFVMWDLIANDTIQVRTLDILGNPVDNQGVSISIYASRTP